jgi:hypothetical protein
VVQNIFLQLAIHFPFVDYYFFYYNLDNIDNFFFFRQNFCL